ncbi:MAG: hypothetical protein WBN10_13560, partial [Polyangiales bacterium]
MVFAEYTLLTGIVVLTAGLALYGLGVPLVQAFYVTKLFILLPVHRERKAVMKIQVENNKTLLADKRGLTTVEYIIVLGLIAVVGIAA